jgi:hypothetical protein
MTMRARLLMVLLCQMAALALSASAAEQQDSIMVPISVTDAEGHRLVVTLGIHRSATRGFDFALGERPIPPVPGAPVLDVRFVDPYRQKGEFAGLDGYVDIRPYLSELQLDTFYVSYRPPNRGSPVTFRWTDSLSAVFQSAVFMSGEKDNLRTWDMTAVSSITLDQRAQGFVIIVTHGPGRSGGKGQSDDNRDSK